LLLSAKDLFVAANGGKLPLLGGSMRSNSTAIALNSAQDLGFNPNGARALLPPRYHAIPKRWAYQWCLYLRRGTAPEVIADPEERLSVRSRVALLDEAAIALNDDYLLHVGSRFRARSPRAVPKQQGLTLGGATWIIALSTARFLGSCPSSRRVTRPHPPPPLASPIFDCLLPCQGDDLAFERAGRRVRQPTNPRLQPAVDATKATA
jgi:hypothetical protein